MAEAAKRRGIAALVLLQGPLPAGQAAQNSRLLPGCNNTFRNCNDTVIFLSYSFHIEGL